MSHKALPSSLLGNNVPSSNVAHISLECMWEFIPCGICHPHLVWAGCRRLLLSPLPLAGEGWDGFSAGIPTVGVAWGRQRMPGRKAGRLLWVGLCCGNAQGCSLVAEMRKSRDGSELRAAVERRGPRAALGCCCSSMGRSSSCLGNCRAGRSSSCLGNYRATTWQSRQQETKLVHKFTGQGLMNSRSPRRVAVP